MKVISYLLLALGAVTVTVWLWPFASDVRMMIVHNYKNLYDTSDLVVIGPEVAKLSPSAT
jgi:hypothetical protein